MLSRLRSGHVSSKKQGAKPSKHLIWWAGRHALQYEFPNWQIACIKVAGRKSIAVLMKSVVFH